MHRPMRILASAAALAALLGATSAASQVAGAAKPAPATATFPVSIPSQYGPVRLAHRPTRIISLSPTATEMLFAIGAGRQVVAVDNDSNYPANAPHSSLSGYTPNVEAIAKYRPDLVVISYNPTQPNLVASLKLLGVPTLYLPAAANLTGTYGEIATLGKATGDRSGAQREIATMRRQIAALVATVPKRASRPSYFYELSSAPIYTATSKTFIGSVLALAGLRNVAGSSVAGSDYPSFSSEVVVRDDPQVIFVADGVSPAAIAKRPGWSSIAAVREHHVVELNADIASRWGPRIVQLLAQAIAATKALKAG